MPAQAKLERGNLKILALYHCLSISSNLDNQVAASRMKKRARNGYHPKLRQFSDSAKPCSVSLPFGHIECPSGFGDQGLTTRDLRFQDS